MGDELLDAEAAVAACRRAGARAAVLHAELAAEQETCQALRRRLSVERDDVRRLRHGSISGLMAKLRGRRDDMVRAEQAEVVAVEAALATHEAAMQRLSVRFAEARDEAQQLPAAEARLAEVVDRREQAIAASGDERAGRLRHLDGELAGALDVRERLVAIHHAAVRCVAALEHALAKLTTAEGLSVVDFLSEGSGGLRHGSTRFTGDWAGRLKHDHLDASVVPVAEAHASLLQLRAELSDASAGAVHRPNVRMPSSRLGAWDVWFDNTFSDLMVHDRITSSISELQRSVRSVEELIADLDPSRRAVDAEVGRLESERADLLRRA